MANSGHGVKVNVASSEELMRAALKQLQYATNKLASDSTNGTALAIQQNANKTLATLRSQLTKEAFATLDEKIKTELNPKPQKENVRPLLNCATEAAQEQSSISEQRFSLVI